MIRPYLRDIIKDHKTQGEQKVNSGNTALIIKLKDNGKFN